MKTASVSAEKAAEILASRFGKHGVYSHDYELYWYWAGKNGPKATVVLPAKWPIDERGDPRCPVEFYDAAGIVGEFDFISDTTHGNGSAGVIFVDSFRRSAAGKAVVNIAGPDWFEAFMLRVSWVGLPDDRPFDYEAHNVLYYARTVSSSGKTGYDWYIIPRNWKFTDEGKARVDKFVADSAKLSKARIESVESRYERLWNPRRQSTLAFIAANSARLADVSRRLSAAAIPGVKIHGTCIEINGHYFQFSDESITRAEMIVRKNELFKQHLGDFTPENFETHQQYEDAVRQKALADLRKEFESEIGCELLAGKNGHRQQRLPPQEGDQDDGFNPGSGITYFREAASNGGGTGYDYYVVPVDRRGTVWDEEMGGPMPEELPVDPEHLARVKAICEKANQVDVDSE